MFYMFSNKEKVIEKFKVVDIGGFTPSKELIESKKATIEEIEDIKVTEIDFNSLSISSLIYLYVKDLIAKGIKNVCVDVSNVNVYGLDWIFAEINQPDVDIAVICDNFNQLNACDDTEVLLDDAYYSDCIEDLIINFKGEKEND